MEDNATEIMRYLAHRYFDGRCFVTHEQFKSVGFVIHHLRYIDNDVIRANYPKGEKGRQLYLKALKPMVEKNPERFMLIKNGIHTRLDHIRTGLTRMKRDNFERLVLAVRMTIKTKRKINKTNKKKKRK